MICVANGILAGARWTGLALMKAAQHGHEGFGGGNQFFAELSSVNPVVMCVRTQTPVLQVSAYQ